MAPVSDHPDEADGRRRRRSRNHEAIVAAVYDLVRAGDPEPSIEAVAARAQVGTRTIYRQFNDLESLARSLGERVTRETLALFTPVLATGELRADLDALVTQRGRVFAHLAPFRRAGRLVRHRVAELRAQDQRFRAALRASLEAVVAPHLPKGAPGADLLEALDLLLSFEAWERLREAQGLSDPRATAVLLRAALALCEASGPG